MNKYWSRFLCYVLLSCGLVLVGCAEGPAGVAETEPTGVEKTPSGEDVAGPEEENNQINYLEFPATELEATKTFYTEVFGWEFTDYGPGYTSFREGDLAGGFTVDREVATGGVLFVLYSPDLTETESRVRESGGRITREIFEFPGGRRFHFNDPSGNELAVWSDR